MSGSKSGPIQKEHLKTRELTSAEIDLCFALYCDEKSVRLLGQRGA